MEHRFSRNASRDHDVQSFHFVPKLFYITDLVLRGVAVMVRVPPNYASMIEDFTVDLNARSEQLSLNVMMRS